jgi:5-methylcytosine-specific restriction endonuclease McrA
VPRKPKDYTGQRFGMRVLLRKTSESRYPCGGLKQTYEYRCDCGEIGETSLASIRTCDSCGCLQRAAAAKVGRGRWVKPKGVAAFNTLLHNYKSRARKKDLRFDLSKEQFYTLTQGQCVFCGTPPQTEIGTNVRKDGTSKTRKTNGSFIYNGIDRKDNAKGYTMDNVQTCCGICNKAKRDLPEKEFLSWIERLVRFQNRVSQK